MSNQDIKPQGSHGITNEVIYGIILKRITKDSVILDFGAGNGYMCQKVGRRFQSVGAQPERQLYACEVDSDKFLYKAVQCMKIEDDSVIPFSDNMFDLIYSIEVVEHTKRPYDFLEQAYGKLKPGGWLLFSVPNILHFKSRLRFLLTGFGEMYGPLSTDIKNAGRICGHIMPLSYPYFLYGLKKCGFSEIEFHADRRKKSSLALSLLHYPLLKLASMMSVKSLKNYDKEVWEENKDVVYKVNSLDMLSSRSCIMIARKPTGLYRATTSE
ncbi:MAG: class I SAM-dependent methyltransferase [Nitrospirae bacterium]|nr:class I SAM-dependent methyltransferase [Nitrospirota bacterium]